MHFNVIGEKRQFLVTLTENRKLLVESKSLLRPSNTNISRTRYNNQAELKTKTHCITFQSV